MAACAPDLLERWQTRVDAMIRDDGLSTAELTDHMPRFLAELTRAVQALPADAPPVAHTWQEPVSHQASLEHGRQRLRDGFDVSEVVREYRILGDVILAACAERDFVPSIADLRLLQATLLAGTGEAISAYVARRDDELRKLASRHLAFIAHEIRNPLGTAWIAADILADRVTSEIRGAVDILRRSLTQLRNRVDDVVNVEAPALTIERVPLAIGGVLAEVRDDLLAEACLKDIDVVVEAADTGEVQGEARLLASAIGNVVRNAIEYSSPGSTVCVRARRDEDAVAIHVEDACGGLPAGYEDMFRPWVRMSERQGGLGLGLAIAKQAIEAHGGRIGVRDRPGVGCVIEIALPGSLS